MPRIHVGEAFPDLSFETYTHEKKTVSEVVAQKKHTLFWVMRFIGCRFCQYDIDDLAAAYDQFTARDAQVFAVVQSTPETITALKGNYSVPFSIICDPQHAFYKALDVKATATKEDRMPQDAAGKSKLAAKKQAVEARNYGKISGDGDAAQQLPALFIVNQEGRVVYAHYAVHSVDMPEIDEMLNLLED